MKDTLGREWTFRFTALTVRDLSRHTGLSTKALAGPNSLLQRIGEDDETLCIALWQTIRPQAEQRGVSEDDWFAALDDVCLQEATKEWLEAYINFSHPARRTVLSKIATESRRQIDEAAKEIEKTLASGEIDAVIQREVTKVVKGMTPTILNEPTTDASSTLESSASIPTLEPSVS
jgi:hypothetical protein